MTLLVSLLTDSHHYCSARPRRVPRPRPLYQRDQRNHRSSLAPCVIPSCSVLSPSSANETPFSSRSDTVQCNPPLANLITRKLGNDDWLLDLNLLNGLSKYADEPAFQKEWDAVKTSNKNRLSDYIEGTLGIAVNRKAIFDVMYVLSSLSRRFDSPSLMDFPRVQVQEDPRVQSVYSRLSTARLRRLTLVSTERQFMNILGTIFRYLQLKKVRVQLLPLNY